MRRTLHIFHAYNSHLCQSSTSNAEQQMTQTVHICVAYSTTRDTYDDGKPKANNTHTHRTLHACEADECWLAMPVAQPQLFASHMAKGATQMTIICVTYFAMCDANKCFLLIFPASYFFFFRLHLFCFISCTKA